MSSFSLSGGVEVTGFISPTDTNDTYPVIDPLYGIDGFRNVNLITDLNTIPEPRRRAGMVVGVSGGTTYYKLNPSPWNYTISDWSLFNTGGNGSGDYLPLSGGTVTGSTTFTSGVFSNTISATTYQNLPTDIRVTGGTYSNGTTIFTNNTGGTFNVTGFYTSANDIFVTGVTYSSNTLTIKRNQSQPDLTTTVGLVTKSNTVTAESFAGTPKKYTVTFTTPYSTTNYSISIIGSDNRSFTYETKTVNGFVINTNANTVLTGNVDWMTISIGES